MEICRRLSWKDLPQELISIIVEHFADDNDALKSCALVGPAWVTPCRLQLFRHITLGPRHFREDSENTLAIFSAMPSLEHSVISLTITSGKPDAASVFPRRLAIDPEFFVALLQKMPNLHTVVLLRCAVKTKGETESILLPPCWDHPRLRLLSIIPSYQLSPVIDVLTTMAVFRRVPVDNVDVLFDHDVSDSTQSAETVYLDDREYELLRGWHVGTLYTHIKNIEFLEAPNIAAGLLGADVTKTLQLDQWGLRFLEHLPESFWDEHGQRCLKGLRLEVASQPLRPGASFAGRDIDGTNISLRP